jgi:catechol 2,3-dioxygenase-like lactoylglutathione lyase family enzyme
MAERIGEIAILVREYDESIAWFTHKLDFVLTEDIPLSNGERWVTVAPAHGQTRLRLARAENAEQAAQVGRQAIGRVLFYLHTENFARDRESFLARGVNFVEAPRGETYGTVAVFEDLYGNRWDLIQRKLPPGALSL